MTLSTVPFLNIQASFATGCLSTFVRCHSFHSQELGVERMGYKPLQGFNLGRLAFLNSLCDTHLQSSNFALCALPVNGMPLSGIVDEGTSTILGYRHLRSHLRRFSKLSRNESRPGRDRAGLDVGSRFGDRQQTPATFRLGPYCMSYPPRYRVAFAFSSLSKPPLHGPALRLACHVLHMADRRLFHVPRN